MHGLYAIADYETLAARGVTLRGFAEEMREAGVTLLQYRDKAADDEVALFRAEEIGSVFEGSDATLIVNDRLDVMLLAGWDGVHVGQDDMAAADARIVAGDGRVIGVSTHTMEEVWEAEQGVADYVAIGPVFATGTKRDAAPVVGLDAVKRARDLTQKPLVAIGGITRANARSVIEAGADAVAVISGLVPPGERPGKAARDFLDLFR
ncbi:thiamine phosphate synthase [Granulicella sp. WH15]|nr:thiamine phosphate synthase [Granulicella sp. WH15]